MRTFEDLVEALRGGETVSYISPRGVSWYAYRFGPTYAVKRGRKVLYTGVDEREAATAFAAGTGALRVTTQGRQALQLLAGGGVSVGFNGPQRDSIVRSIANAYAVLAKAGLAQRTADGSYVITTAGELALKAESR